MFKTRYAILSLLFACLSPILVGQEVEALSFEDLSTWMHPAAEDEQVYVINFWATWCKPCVEEMPYFEALHDKYKEEGVTVLFVSLDFASQLENRVKPFVKKREIQSKVVLLDAGDPNKWIDLVDPQWSGAIPATLFVKGHKRQFVEASFHDLNALEQIIQSL